MAVPAQIVQWLRRSYPKPTVDPEWLDACCNWILEEYQLQPPNDVDEIIKHVDAQLLQSNLVDSMVHGTGLPANIPKDRNSTLTGPPVLVEITALTDIGVSAFSLQNTRQTRIDRADLAGLAEEDGGEDDGPVPRYPRGMLRFEISDGATTLAAIEYRKIPELELGETPLGYKLLLKNVPIKRGIAFLEPKNIELRGYLNEDREARRDKDFVRSLRVRTLGPNAVQDDISDDEQPPPPQNEPVQAQPPPVQPPPPPPPPAPAHTNGRAPPSTGPRSPLRQVSRPPSPGPSRHDDDGPRRRRIPAPPAQSMGPPASSGTTLVQSSYFRTNGAGASSAASTSTVVGQRLFSPPRTVPTMEIDTDEEDPEPPARAQAGEPPMGSQLRPIPIEPSTQYFFDDDPMDDPQFLQELDGVLESQSQTAASQEPTAQNPSTSQTQPPRARQLQPSISVISIDDDEDDKENAPVPTRRVRPRTARTFDPDVIDISD